MPQCGVPADEFTNADIYAHPRELEKLHPDNRHVRDNPVNQTGQESASSFKVLAHGHRARCQILNGLTRARSFGLRPSPRKAGQIPFAASRAAQVTSVPATGVCPDSSDRMTELFRLELVGNQRKEFGKAKGPPGQSERARVNPLNFVHSVHSVCRRFT